jgi:hypothetical protein
MDSQSPFFWPQQPRAPLLGHNDGQTRDCRCCFSEAVDDISVDLSWHRKLASMSVALCISCIVPQSSQGRLATGN